MNSNNNGKNRKNSISPTFYCNVLWNIFRKGKENSRPSKNCRAVAVSCKRIVEKYKGNWYLLSLTGKSSMQNARHNCSSALQP